MESLLAERLFHLPLDPIPTSGLLSPSYGSNPISIGVSRMSRKGTAEADDGSESTLKSGQRVHKATNQTWPNVFYPFLQVRKVCFKQRVHKLKFSGLVKCGLWYPFFGFMDVLVYL
ncbi:hypothetical protein CEXT_507461 [Caerostris extrusa]|uniref:Uncharacterized protein n=1 Tax=Caerostris extrusa TaxID=172846 RepID=A0AAV4N9D4_CAEEX|nr:hypothetical protein CEXT_507461 [Caerostris extrusa]